MPAFRAPGSAGAAAAGSGAAEQRMRAEARDTGGGGPARRAPGAQGRCAPRAGGGETGLPGRLGPMPTVVALDHNADLGWAGGS